MWIYLQNTFPAIVKTVFPLGIITVNVKDVWKWIVGQRIGNTLSKSFDAHSDFNITLGFHYSQDVPEANTLSVFIYSYFMYLKISNHLIFLYNL